MSAAFTVTKTSYNIKDNSFLIGKIQQNTKREFQKFEKLTLKDYILIHLLLTSERMPTKFCNNTAVKNL